MKKLTDYTHKNIKIKDIRLKKGKSDKEKFVALILEGLEDRVLYVNYEIFNERLKSYFLGKSLEDLERQEILSLTWNFIITQGYFYKILDKNLFEIQESSNPKKWFVSVLEISGPLGEFNKVFSQEVKLQNSSTKLKDL